MSNYIKSFGAIGLLVLGAACAPAPVAEQPVMQPQPVATEPLFTGKFR